MAYEIGKQYVFKENEFEKSRESGKLVFKVKSTASASPYIVKPFEFQIRNIPDKLVCIYKGNDRFEQDLNALIPTLYEVGKIYRFRVMRQDTNAAGNVSIRDDDRCLTFYPVKLGKRKFERFQRINCRVISVDNGDLKLEWVNEQEQPKKNFGMADLGQLRGGRLLLQRNFLKRLMDSPVFDDARTRYEEGNPQWVVIGLEAITHNLPMWFPVGGGGYRTHLLRQVRDLALSLIEQSDYLNVFPMDERRGVQNRLSDVIIDSEDYLHAAELIHRGKDVDFITETLHSLKSTGWLYKPEKKMRLMMALFTLKNSYAHDYIWEIFNVISDHRDDRRFLEEFAEGFILMLQIFIDNESKFVNTESRDALRALIEAIAIQLLLTQNKDYARWNIYRGRLYTLALLLIGTPSPVLAEKGVGAFTDTLDTPLEFGWKDIADVNRLCHVNLNSLRGMEPNRNRPKVISTFDGQNASLSVSDGKMQLTPAVEGSDLRAAIELPLFRDSVFSVMLNRRFDSRTSLESGNLTKQHMMWRDMERSLFDPDQNLRPTEMPQVKLSSKISPVVGDRVTFRVIDRDENDQFTFRCKIEDEDFSGGDGIINTRDIVAYPVSPYTDTFWTDEGQMLLRGRVIEAFADGTFRFSLDKEADQEIMRIAEDDLNEEILMEAVITKDLGESCLAVTDGGYPVSFNKNGNELTQSQKVLVKISTVGWNKKANRPYISAAFEGFPEEENDPVKNYRDVRNGFHYLLTQISGDNIYIPQTQRDEEVEEEEVEAPKETLPELYLTGESVNGLSRLLDAMACVTQGDITEVYSLLAVARLLALLNGDTYRAHFLELKQALVEGLSSFAIDGRSDRNVVRDLERRVHLFPANDADLNRRVEILKVLSTLDIPSMGEIGKMPDDTDQSMLGSLKRMVVSYNMLRGLKLNPLRQEIRRSIYELLNLQMPQIDITRVNASEDLHNEFKESLIYPAGNNMKADEKKQGREIAEVIDGMLNTDGGTLYIGVANTGIPHGLAGDFIYLNNGFEEYDPEDVKDKFSLRFCKLLREQFGLTVEGVQVYPTLVTLEFDDINDHCFAVVTVKPFPGVVKMTDGSVYLRQDSSTLPLKKKADQAALAKTRAQLYK